MRAMNFLIQKYITKFNNMKNHNNGKISLIILLLIIFMGILVSIIYNKKDLQIEGKIIEKKI